MVKIWFRSGNSYNPNQSGNEYSQVIRNSARNVEQNTVDDGTDAPDPGVLVEPIVGPVAAGGGAGKGGGGSGTAPTDVTLTNASVDDDSASGTVIGIFGAIDSDRKERFAFSLIDDAGGLFTVNGNNKLTVADGANLDFETQSTYDIIVQVTDKQGHTYQETITISINNLIEIEPVNTAPTDITLSSMTVDENSAAGTIIGTLGNNDPDSGDSWTYLITSDPDGKFDILGGQLVRRSGATLDYETAGSHSVTIRVTDCAGASYSETFTIGVNDIAEGVVVPLIDDGRPICSFPAAWFWKGWIPLCLPMTGARTSFSISRTVWTRSICRVRASCFPISRSAAAGPEPR
jgi:hypothetical protein